MTTRYRRIYNPVYKSHCSYLRRSSRRHERLDHHLPLSLVRYQEALALADRLNRVNDLVEATGGSALLRHTRNAQRRSRTVLNDGHNLTRK